MEMNSKMDRNARQSAPIYTHIWSCVGAALEENGAAFRAAASLFRLYLFIRSYNYKPYMEYPLHLKNKIKKLKENI